MKTIDVKYIDTTKYVVKLHNDFDSESPCDWGNFDVKIFNSGFRGDLDNAEREDFYDENDNLTIGMRSKLRAGTAFPVGVRHYSGTDGGYYSVTDIDNADGFILFDKAYVKGESYERRKGYAEGDLETYQQWCNGEVYWCEITTADGREIDTCGGIYGTEGIKDYVHGELGEAQNVELIGVYDDGTTYEVDL